MTIYKVFDDEWEKIMGETQIREFAISQVCNCPNDFIKENITQIEDKDRLVKLAEKIQSNNNFSTKDLTIKDVELILTERCFDIEKLDVY